MAGNGQSNGVTKATNAALSKRKTRGSGFLETFSKPSQIAQDLQAFAEKWKKDQFFEIVSAVEKAESTAAKPSKSISIKVPASGLSPGQTSERMMMQALGWYWEPLLYDLAFYEEMRDSIALLDGEIQKMVDVALDGFKLQCSDPQKQSDLEKALIRDPNVNLRETLRSAMVDMFSLGTCYKLPIWKTDDKGRLTLKTFKPVRATAMRLLRDEDLCTKGYVQLLHRPSEFIFGPTPPQIPTIWLPEEVIHGTMRTYGWYAYGRPLLASLPFIVRLKLTMERDLAEMLHQHVPRIDVTFTPDQQMTDEQVTSATKDTQTKVSNLRTTDNWVHTPDTEFEYKGPAGKGLDFSGPQNHTEDQFFYVLPFAQSIMGKQSTENPYASKQHWTLACIIATSLRTCIETMFAPTLDRLADAWGLEDPGITFGWSQLDPEGIQELATANEMGINNAVLSRDNGFIDQDSAAQQATAHHPNGSVKKAAAPGKLPPPLDPNKPVAPAAPGNAKVRKMGPKTDGTKSPDKDNRPKGRRHAFYAAMIDDAVSRLIG